MLPFVAPQRVLPDKGGLTEITSEGFPGLQLSNLSGVAFLWPISFPLTCYLFSDPDLFGMGFLHMGGQIAPLLGIKAAELTLERAVLGVDPLVDFEGRLVGTGIAALRAFHGLLGLVDAQMLPETCLIPALELADEAFEGILHVVLDADVGLQVTFHGTPDLAELTFVRLLPCVHTHVPLQVRVDFKFGRAQTALERSISCLGDKCLYLHDRDSD